MSNEEPKMCTTSGRPVDVVRAEQTESTGQHKDYIVLCPDERAKGFIRPVRTAYKHVGRSVCGHYMNKADTARPDEIRDVCGLPFRHDGECTGQFFSVDGYTHAEILDSHRYPVGCGAVTTMGGALAETYARDPKFYGATFCVRCNKHLPVGEFTWSADGEVVGS